MKNYKILHVPSGQFVSFKYSRSLPDSTFSECFVLSSFDNSSVLSEFSSFYIHFTISELEELDFDYKKINLLAVPLSIAQLVVNQFFCDAKMADYGYTKLLTSEFELVEDINE